MQDAPGNDETLPRPEIHGAILEINQKAPLHNEEEFVLGVMLVPVILAVHDAETDHGVVHPAEGLVIPRILAGLHERRNVDWFQRSEEHV